MVTVSDLEAVSGGACVGLCNVVVGCGNLGLATLARSSCLQYSFVVSVNESFHVFATTVAYAYVVSVKKFRKLVIGRKVFVNKLQEVSCDVRLDIFTKWRVKPQYVSLSVAFGMGFCVCWFIFELGGKVAVF